MMRMLFGFFLILHGLVHLLYAGQSRRLFELQPGMTWPEGSWLLVLTDGGDAVRNIASVGLIAAALIFVLGGAALLAAKPWYRFLVAAAAIVSIAVFLLCWDGTLKHLGNQGIFGIAINAGVVIISLALLKQPV